MEADAPDQVWSEGVRGWLMSEGRRIADAKAFLESVALRLNEAGVDVARMTTGVPILHPQLFSYSSLWERGSGVTERLYRADSSQDMVLANSPISSVYGGRPFRGRLAGQAVKGEFPTLGELRRADFTDDVVLPVPFSDGPTRRSRSPRPGPADFMTVRSPCSAR